MRSFNQNETQDVLFHPVKILKNKWPFKDFFISQMNLKTVSHKW